MDELDREHERNEQALDAIRPGRDEDLLSPGTKATVDRWKRQADALGELRRAVHDFGPHPEHHVEIMERHRREWPRLWEAIDKLVGRG
jgi:hypothetical protein